MNQFNHNSNEATANNRDQRRNALQQAFDNTSALQALADLIDSETCMALHFDENSRTGLSVLLRLIADSNVNALGILEDKGVVDDD